METGNCGLSVCKCQSDICQVRKSQKFEKNFSRVFQNGFVFQLRLDFNTFMIAGPTTSTVTDTNVLHGVPTAGGTAAVRFGNCDTDQFTVTNPGGTGSRVICGTNTGEHSKEPVLLLTLYMICRRSLFFLSFFPQCMWMPLTCATSSTSGWELQLRTDSGQSRCVPYYMSSGWFRTDRHYFRLKEISDQTVTILEH